MSDRDLALEVKDVLVEFRSYVEKKPTFRRMLPSRKVRQATPMRALAGVSFNVDRGEAFGIIGRNGAGKSTLLRVIAGTLRPNGGSVTRYGQTSTLLQLGVGFNTQLSGRENIFLGGLAAGLSSEQIREKLDSIIEYAELRQAIERPVKTYSSGMFSRLAFSISMHLEPDILLLDEVLAVGDESFREKSMEAMYELLDRTGTIVFVSHSLDNVANFCNRALWLEDGSVRAIGPARRIVDQYRRSASTKAASIE